MTDNVDMSVYNMMIRIFDRDDIPYINTKDRFGVTGYVDFIHEDEVTHPIMKSRDSFGRKIIIIKFIMNYTVFIQTFFQREAFFEDLWMGAYVRGNNHFTLLNTIGGLTEHQAKLLLDISLGKTVIVDENHKIQYIENKSYIGNEIFLYDDKIIKAANLIQRHWDICRYNPVYKIAKKFLEEGYKSVKSLYKN
tara:strand:+ start:157 stop:735 length:579 start_codon:yes stop_codon:yes gene_type:complete